jgi:predicted ATP-grasp superfamily ATP-dependent carboligase
MRWRSFCKLIVDLAEALGTQMVVTLGALLADVPHTRPVPMTGLASDEELVQRFGFERSTYEGPTGIVGVLHHACAAANLPSVSLWASVPHYVAAAPNPKAALALIRSFEGVAGIAVEARDLEESAEDYERQVNAAVASDPEVKSFVERLEQTLDETQDVTPDRLPSADAIARDFQRFLRQRGPDGPR